MRELRSAWRFDCVDQGSRTGKFESGLDGVEVVRDLIGG